MKSDYLKLSIFDTFKTKPEELTGEAIRQRSIIAQLATETSPKAKTRTAISQRIAERHGIVWKNIYSGIFHDLEKVLIPYGIAEEAGRLPLKRGPKALQEKGIPFYQLTQTGLLIALSLNEIIEREKILKEFFLHATGGEKAFQDIIQKLAKIAPRFTFSLFEKHVKAFCKGRLDRLLPFTVDSLKKVSDESVIIQSEFLEGFTNLPNSEKEKTVNFLKSFS